MLELHRKGELTQQTQYNVSDEWLAASLDRCRQPGQETGNYIICSKDLLGMGPVRAVALARAAYVSRPQLAWVG
jgi:hypothetical protein